MSKIVDIKTSIIQIPSTREVWT